MSVERRRQSKLQKILAAKIIVKKVKTWLQVKRARDSRKKTIGSIVKIQKWF
jgi:hypothetical protein